MRKREIFMDIGFIINTPAIWKLILKEHGRQIKKWGNQSHHGCTWMSILGEEVGELHKAILEYNHGNGTLDKIIHEAISVATLGAKIAVMAIRKKR